MLKRLCKPFYSIIDLFVIVSVLNAVDSLLYEFVLLATWGAISLFVIDKYYGENWR